MLRRSSSKVNIIQFHFLFINTILRRSPALLVDLSVIIYLDKNQGQNCSDDMALFRLIIDAMEECAVAVQTGHSCENSLHSSVECVVALLASLQSLCSGEIATNILSDQTVKVLNNRYGKLKEVDYSGPLTYQSMARLPAAYRFFLTIISVDKYKVNFF